MDKKKFVIVPVDGLTPKQLEDEMNIMADRGYRLTTKSNLQWYQGTGESGVLVFELEELVAEEEDVDTLGLIKELVVSEHFTKSETVDKIAALLGVKGD